MVLLQALCTCVQYLTSVTQNKGSPADNQNTPEKVYNHAISQQEQNTSTNDVMMYRGQTRTSSSSVSKRQGKTPHQQTAAAPTPTPTTLSTKKKEEAFSTKKKPQKSMRSLLWELGLCTVGLVGLVSPGIYKTMFDDGMRITYDKLPSPVGLGMGIGLVAVGQVFTLGYYALAVHTRPLVKGHKPASGRALVAQIMGHLTQPEGFYLLFLYLSGTWMFNMMPQSYYSFEGGVNWMHVLMQLLCVDFFQFVNHLLEHKVSTEFYKISHKPHHFFIHPRLTDAYDGSPMDTMFMILVPLYLTCNIVHCNVWSYMAFGAIYGNFLCLLHAEFDHPWDGVFYYMGIMTPGDHRVHHSRFKFNYAHLFTYYDRLYGTYRDPIKATDE